MGASCKEKMVFRRREEGSYNADRGKEEGGSLTDFSGSPRAHQNFSALIYELAVKAPRNLFNKLQKWGERGALAVRCLYEDASSLVVV